MIGFSEYIVTGKNVIDNVNWLAEQGCETVELWMEGDGYSHNKLNAIKKGLKQLRFKYSLHPPATGVNLTSSDPFHRARARYLHDHALEFAYDIGADYVVFHPGIYEGTIVTREELKKLAFEYLLEYSRRALILGIKIAFENVGFHVQSLYTMEEFCGLLDQMPPEIGYVVDLGHAHINGWDLEKVLERVKEKLISIHIHDNDGRLDLHQAIYQGTIDWKKVFAFFPSLGEDVHYILEYAPSVLGEELRIGKKILLESIGEGVGGKL